MNFLIIWVYSALAAYLPDRLTGLLLLTGTAGEKIIWVNQLLNLGKYTIRTVKFIANAVSETAEFNNYE